MSSPYVVKWGILGCGCESTKLCDCFGLTGTGMSSMFVKDLCYPPSTRKTEDVSHAVVAVGSRSREKAVDFIKTSCPAGAAAQKDGLVDVPVTAYGSYEEVVNDPVGDIPYENSSRGELTCRMWTWCMSGL